MTYTNKDYEEEVTAKTLSAQAIIDIKREIAAAESNDSNVRAQQVEAVTRYVKNLEENVEFFQGPISSKKRRRKGRGLFLF
jgi:hypothetical protein